MDQTTECRECYAAVTNMNRHRSWHQEQERKLRDLESKIRRASRGS